MKTSFFKIAAMLLVLTGILSFCGGKNEGEEPVKPVTIIGKWKLTGVSIMYDGLHDYSAYNIVYEFNANGVLTISGVPEQIEYYGSAAGDYNYAIIEDDDKIKKSYDGRTLKISNSYYGHWYDTSSGYTKMTIDKNSWLDGPKEYLTKIQ